MSTTIQGSNDQSRSGTANSFKGFAPTTALYLRPNRASGKIQIETPPRGFCTQGDVRSTREGAALVAASQLPPLPSTIWSDWAPQALYAVPLAVLLVIYCAGVARRVNAVGWQGIAWWQPPCFVTGWAILVVALLTPLMDLVFALATAHMLQYFLLTTIAPPFLVVASPLCSIAYAFAPRRPGTAALWREGSVLARIWHISTLPLVVGAIDLGLLVGWHLAPLYEAALANSVLYAFQQATFVVGALLFWWVIIHPNAPGDRRPAATLVSIIATSMLATAFAMAMFFSGTTWYPSYARTTEAWGLSAKEDQQIAAVVLVSPSDTTDLISFIWVLALWLRKQEDDQVQRERVARITARSAAD